MEETPYNLAVEEARRGADAQAAALNNVRGQVTSVVTIGGLVATFIGGFRQGHLTVWTALAITAFVALVVCAVLAARPIGFYTSQKPSVLIGWVKTGESPQYQQKSLAKFMEQQYDHNEERIKHLNRLHVAALIALMLELVFFLIDLRGR